MVKPQRFDLNICKFNIALFLRAVLLLSPVMLLFYQENGLTVRDLFFFQGIFYLISIVSEIPVGYLSDNISRKKLLIISFIIFMGFYTLWFFFHGYYVILAGEILFGISKVMMDNAMSGYLYDYLTSKQNKTAMVKYYGYLNFYLSLGTALGGLIGTYIYSKFGSGIVIISEIFLIAVSIMFVLSLPSIKCETCKMEILSEKVSRFFSVVKELYKNISITYYIFYSGLLASFSILFALSFQPLMQNAFFPIFLFGVIAFINHAVRAFSGIVAGKWLRRFDIKKMVVPLFVLYILAFICVFNILSLKNIRLLLVLLLFICLVIGVQVIFTILHISRIHKFVTIEKRGTLMAINNFVSRVMAAIILITSKLFIDKLGLSFFFTIAFMIFLILCSYFMVKIINLKEKA